MRSDLQGFLIKIEFGIWNFGFIWKFLNAQKIRDRPRSPFCQLQGPAGCTGLVPMTDQLHDGLSADHGMLGLTHSWVWTRLLDGKTSWDEGVPSWVILVGKNVFCGKVLKGSNRFVSANLFTHLPQKSFNRQTEPISVCAHMCVSWKTLLKSPPPSELPTEFQSKDDTLAQWPR